ncbi:MAG TPA: cell division protein SepF [Candidatus Nanopelagicales bacterium]|jgi:cell division inhibitor SepF|nr:cell division protein SepF [Candidatus Nanopelagicales bacterium]
MGAMRKMAVYLGLVEDELDDYVDESDPYEQAVARRRAESVRVAAPVGGRASEDAGYTAVRQVRPAPRPAPPEDRTERVDLRESAEAPFDQHDGADSYRITTLHPRSYNDARRIGEEFRQHIPVIMNLTEMDDEDAKRIIDFAAGLIFGLQGSIERVTNKVFLLSPANVDVAAEARRLAQDGFFNQS